MMPHWLEAATVFLSATLLFRLGGKETISTMRIGQAIVMIGIASILVEPLKTKSLWVSIYGAALLILMSLLATYVHIYFPKTKRWLMGQPIVLIKNGQIIHQNLKRARTTVDDLKMRLRSDKVTEISMVKYATLEPSGRLGIEFFPEYSYATKRDIDELKEAILLIGNELKVTPNFFTPTKVSKDNLFFQAENVQEKDPLQ
jgi:uncharacterized membrane protein YcaP (DUF421 family)